MGSPRKSLKTAVATLSKPRFQSNFAGAIPPNWQLSATFAETLQMGARFHQYADDTAAGEWGVLPYPLGIGNTIRDGRSFPHRIFRTRMPAGTELRAIAQNVTLYVTCGFLF